MTNNTTSAVTDATFESAFIVNTVIAVIALFAFSMLRTKFPKVYAPRLTHLDSTKCVPASMSSSFSNGSLRPVLGAIDSSTLQQLRSSSGAAHHQAFVVPRGLEHFRHGLLPLCRPRCLCVCPTCLRCGSDCRSMLMYARFCIKLFIVCTLYGFIVLIPINSTDTYLKVWLCPQNSSLADWL